MGDVLVYDDLSVGDEWTSVAREISARDVHEFASLTGDSNPLHVDPVYAEQTPFRRPIAHGLLGLALVGGLGSQSPQLADVVLIGIREWLFRYPVYYGDRVHVINRVEKLEPHGRRHGKVLWKRQLVNAHGQTVQEGILETLVARRMVRHHVAHNRMAAPSPVSG